ncbi:SET and MYND domain-containing protein 5 [Hondaea fermentalgiana]|uniref:SET and MYND domain-containing protein 5 n=1 Tax=Hondaea fermentalgiana TaxID=2315210 RepID=A0A2R5GBC0_9STRA|nr:SET and MYND domain-containing protein 5 [Hondaea fermentalgiana]|eukprot:GBG28297.1 SET and MYND domain-containing protein 5 [Hondaea fermentalgiana]
MQGTGASAGASAAAALNGNPDARRAALKVFENAPVQVLFGRGIMRDQPSERGLFATQDLVAGSLVFEEDPLVAIQLNKAECAACEHCARFLGKLPNAVSLGSTVDRLALQGVVPCKGFCGELYCTESCRDAAAVAGHDALCSGRCESVEEPLIHFKVHAMETLDAFLLVGKAFARVLVQSMETFGKDGAPTAPNWTALDQFAPSTGSLADDPATEDPAFIQSLCETSHEFLLAAFHRYLLREGMDAAEADRHLVSFSLPRFCNTMLKLRRNTFGISITNPLVDFITTPQNDELPSPETVHALLEPFVESVRAQDQFLEEGEEEEEEEDESHGHSHSHGHAHAHDHDYHDHDHDDAQGCCDDFDEHHDHHDDAKDVAKTAPGEHEDSAGDRDDGEEEEEEEGDLSVEDILEDLEGWFAPVDGEALFAGACVMNHASEPNIRIEYTDCNRCRAIALCDISAGAELVHDYVRFVSPAVRFGIRNFRTYENIDPATISSFLNGKDNKRLK